MKNNIVWEVPLNDDYLISKGAQNVDFIDNYQLTSDNLTYLPEPKDLMIAFFRSFPGSFKILLQTREFIAKKLGLKTAPESEKESRLQKLHEFKGDIGDSVAVFEVLDKTEKELLTGQNDAHLDFKLSFIVYKHKDSVNLEMATTVIINNTLGKLYFAVVKPIHKFYMKKIMRKMEKELVNKCW